MFSRWQRMLEDSATGVSHATLNPGGPGAVHIHLVPPKPSFFPAPWLVFLNGWYVLPVSPSEARLLRYFIEEISRIRPKGEEFSDTELKEMLEMVARRMHRMYPQIDQGRFKNDLVKMVNIFVVVARGEIPEDLPKTAMTLANYAKHMTGPHRMDLIVSPMSVGGKRLCPNHCGICYASGQPAMSVERELTTEQWKTIIDRCWQVGSVQLSFTGGETLKRLDLPELVAHAAQFVTRVNTSGVGLTSELARKLFEASLDAIQVTLYSSIPAIHELLVGRVGAWEETVQGIKNAKEAGLCVSVNVPLLGVNKNFERTLEFLHEIGITFVSCSGIIPAGGGSSVIDQGGALDRVELFKILRRAVKYCESVGMELAFTSPGWLTAGQMEELNLTAPVCGACLGNMAITPSGAVVPCQSWLGDEKGLGNMSTTPWKRIWNSRRCLEIRLKMAARNNCPLLEVGK